MIQPFNQDCKCILSVDNEVLDERFSQLQVHRLLDPSGTIKEEDETVLTVSQVESIGVCSKLCTEPDLINLANTWQYDTVNHLCSCIWLELHTCHLDSVLANPVEPETSMTMSINNGSSILGFIQLVKVIPCSTHNTN